VSPHKYNDLRLTQGPIVLGGLQKYTSHSPQYRRDNCSHSVECPSSKVCARLSGDDVTEGSKALLTPFMQRGLQPFSPMSRGWLFNPPPMGPNQTREDARGISGPPWCPQDPIRSIGHHPNNDRSGRGAEAF